MTAWHEEDNFWETVPMFDERHWEMAPEQVEGVLSLLDLEPGARLLDLPCGVGRHSLELARRGYRVTGVDRTSGPIPDRICGKTGYRSACIGDIPMIVDLLTDLIGHTPMLRLNRLAAGLDAEILAKLELLNPYSLKDRPALYMIEAAERSGQLRPGGTIVEASSGNAGTALAYIGRLKGYRVVICMSENMSDEHKQRMRALGADLELTPAEEAIEGSRRRARALAESLPNAVYFQQHFNEANVQSHFETTAEEIWRDTEGRVDVFIHGLGSCGTMTGVARALKARKPSVRCVGYEPAGAALISQGEFEPHKLLGIGPGFMPGLFDPDVMDEIRTVHVEDAFAACRQIALKEGLLVGITSGASAHLALELARRPEYAGQTFVVIFADSGQGYLSVPGLFEA